MTHTSRTWRLAHGRSLEIGRVGVLMGILNVTPDSFSDGGTVRTVDEAEEATARMVAEGAAIVDVGGESTRPDAQPVSAAEEQSRVIPVIEALADRGDVLISIDTYRAETARLALRAGAHIVNDIWGLQRDAGIARLAADLGAGLVLMHNGRDRFQLRDVIEDQRAFLGRSLAIARSEGIGADHLVLDPGFGFAKNASQNLELIARFGELFDIGRHWLVGTSRKRFLGAVTGREAADRDSATAATTVALRLNGASIFRVHAVGQNSDALKLADAILAARSAEAVSP